MTSKQILMYRKVVSKDKIGQPKVMVLAPLEPGVMWLRGRWITNSKLIGNDRNLCDEETIFR